MGKNEIRRRRYEYCLGNTHVHMGVNLARISLGLLSFPPADMCIAYVNEIRRRRYEYCRGNTHVHMGVNLARINLGHLSFPPADIFFSLVSMGSVGVDLSIALGILIFRWE